MNQQIKHSKHQNISPQQFKGFLDKKIKLKIAIEEWIQSEINYQSQQYENFIKTRVILADGLFQRPTTSVSAFWYEFTEEYTWIFISYPIIQKLNQNMFTLLSKLMVDTINLFKDKNKNFRSIQEAEKEAYRLYIEDMNRIRSNKAIIQAERMKQVLYLLINQYFRQKLPVLNSEAFIPQSDTLLINKLNHSYTKLKNNILDFQKKQIVGDIKFRMIPYLFQDIIIDNKNFLTNPLRLKVSHSIIVRNASKQQLFSVIILTTQFVEILANDSRLLDYILASDIIAIEHNLKYNRGQMEQEIYSIVSKDVDTTEKALLSYYSKEEILNARTELEDIFNKLVFDKKVNILKIYD